MTLQQAELPTVAVAEPANVAEFVAEWAQRRPAATAAIEQATGRRISFGELGRNVAAIAAGLRARGICNGMRAVLAIKPGIEFVELVYAMFHAGAVPVVLDPGMGRKNLLACIAEARAEALVGIPLAHALSLRHRRAFGGLKHRVTVGRRWLWGGCTLAQLRATQDGDRSPPRTQPGDVAAVLFTSGATGVPKGVIYTHGILARQTTMIRDAYGIQPGEVDVACFALFALFSVAMGVTIVLPAMDFSRPGRADPAVICQAVREHKATMAFASPAVWRKVGPWLEQRGETLPGLRRVLIAGAAVPFRTLEQLAGRIAPGGLVHTPYGATESLPVSTISSAEVLGETRSRTLQGAGVCVGQPLPGVSVRVIAVYDGPLADLGKARECRTGQVGEILVQSATTTRGYFGRPEADARSKIRDGEGFWHRMGDTGWLDELGRLWYCGRVAHTVWTSAGPLFPEQVEGVFAAQAGVARCALVGVGARGAQDPVLVVERSPGSALAEGELLALAALQPAAAAVTQVLFHPSLPVDVRHNAKIDREALSRWAAREVGSV
ncbi:MAG: AMP-binding protein [Planctomycetes bacterium]|nr:AMP-binding protein [Planctomycetota bacterium]